MSATTSSEDKPVEDDSTQRDSETADEQEPPPPAYPEHDEPERKRRRTASEKAREMRMQSYAKARIQELESGLGHAPEARRRTPSVEPSITRSDDGSRSSPAQRLFHPRVGKRVRRKPQRWEGERIERPARVGRREESIRDEESTVSLRSALSVAEPPSVDSPFEDLKTAIAQSGAQPSRRDIVDSFHSWQLRIVSKQAAQQKALHVYLKRRLRKRTTRSPEYDRLEEDALRNARSAVAKLAKEGPSEQNGDQETTVEDELHGNNLVPGKLRLPLEAYLPRRVRPRGKGMKPEDILQMLSEAPHYPGSKVLLDKDGEQKWMTLPTVSASSDWNTRKSAVRRRAPAVKNEKALATESEDVERGANE